MDLSTLPAGVRATMASFLTAELTTLSPAGVPQTWPVLPSVCWGSGRIAVATSVGLGQKARNIRRNPDVCLLFSDPTGSGLDDPPSVLVEGVAGVADKVITSFGQIDDEEIRQSLERDAVELLRRQPAVKIYTGSRPARALMDWYFLRLLIVVSVSRVSWGSGDRAAWESVDVA